MTISTRARTHGGLWGSLIGDALGVPVEFMDRTTVQANPVNDMIGYGTHNQPPGTWSDDGALILCTTDSLNHHEFDTQDMGQRFVEWMYRGLWTAWGEPFDIGVATSDALMSIENGMPAEQAGGRDEYCNGNGSLMRILPVALRFASESQDVFEEHLDRASSITHRHPRSKMACLLFGLVIRELLHGQPPKAALDIARSEFKTRQKESPSFPHFQSLLEDDFVSTIASDISSSGYVLNTLHASLWCLLTTNSFKECVLKAVNLGHDTDTTGCVAGGMAGVYYGISTIPTNWIQALPRQNDLELLFNKFTNLIPFPA